MKTSAKKFVACLNNKGYEVSLEKRKIYVAISDSMALKHGHVRVIDESGEDYLFPASNFVVAPLPAALEEAVQQAGSSG